MDFKSNKIKFAIAAIVLVVIGLVSSRLMKSGEDATGFLRNRGSQPCTVYVINNEPDKNIIYTERGSSQRNVHFFTLDPSRECNDDLALTTLSLLCQERGDYTYRDLTFIQDIRTLSNTNVNFDLSRELLLLREPLREKTPFFFNFVSQNELDISNICSFQLAKIGFNQRVEVKFKSELRDYNDYNGRDYRALPLGNLISRPSSDVMHIKYDEYNDNRLVNGVNTLQKFELSLNNDSRNNAKLFVLPLRIEKSNFEINSIKLIMNQNGEIIELAQYPYYGWVRDTFDLDFSLYNYGSDYRSFSFLNQPLITNNPANYKLEVTGRRIDANFPAKLKSYVRKDGVQYCINVPERDLFISTEIDFDCYIGLDKYNENPIVLTME